MPERGKKVRGMKGPRTFKYTHFHTSTYKKCTLSLLCET
jgi:hypothetical protein